MVRPWRRPGSRLQRWYYLWSAVRNGRMDGERHIPVDTDETPPPYLLALHGRVQEWVTGVVLQWLASDGRHHQRYTGAVAAVAAGLSALAAAGAAEHTARARLAAAGAEAAERERRANPPAQWQISPGWYTFCVGALALGDLPLTAYGFQVLALSPALTWMVSLLVVVLLAGLGHVVGHQLRQIRVSPYLPLGVAAVLGVGFSLVVAYLREASVQAVGQFNSTMDPLGATLLFVVVTLLAFVLPALLALHCRESPGAHRVRQARREWEQARRAGERARTRLARARRELGRAIIVRQGAQAAAAQEVARLQALGRTLWHLYSTANLRAREGGHLPPALAAGSWEQAALAAGSWEQADGGAGPERGAVHAFRLLTGPLEWSPSLHRARELLDEPREAGTSGPADRKGAE